MALGVVNLFEIRLVADGLDAFLKWDDVVVAGHDDDGAKFESLGQMHRADRDAAGRRLEVVVQDDGHEAGFLYCLSRSADLSQRTHVTSC